MRKWLFLLVLGSAVAANACWFEQDDPELGDDDKNKTRQTDTSPEAAVRRSGVPVAGRGTW